MRRLLAVVVCALLAPLADARAGTIETIDLPSRVVDETTANFNEGGALKANVLLPDGYRPRKTYPLLLLLHGAGDTYRSWTDPDRGDIVNTAEGLNAIVVMPDGATGFYTNWWRDGMRGDPAWETYFLDEVLPAIRSRYRIRAGRRWHAIAGLSMGGFGATFLGGREPGYFGSVSAFSGFVDHQRPTIFGGGLQAVSGVDYETIYGPPDAFYATGHNPARLVANLRESRLYVATGDGTVDPEVGASSPGAAAGGGAVEVEIRQQNDAFVAAATAADVPLTYVPHAGVHDWPYWRNDLRGAIATNLFAPIAERPDAWENTTVARSGELFGVRYRFAEPPSDLVRFEREDDTLRVDGPPLKVVLRTPGGCRRAGTLPLELTLERRPCARLRPRVRPRTATPGTRILLRVRTGIAGARVQAAGLRTRADDAGFALLRIRTPAEGGTVAVVRATHPDRRAGVTGVRVRQAG